MNQFGTMGFLYFLLVLSSTSLFIAPCFAQQKSPIELIESYQPNLTDACADLLDPEQTSEFHYVYHSTARENIQTLSKYGFFNTLGHGTLAENLDTYDFMFDPRLHEAGVIFAFRAPKELLISGQFSSYGLSLSENSLVASIPNIQIYIRGSWISLQELTQSRRRPLGNIPANFIDWQKSVRATAQGYLKYSNPEVPRNHRSFPKQGFEEKISWERAVSLAKDAFLSQLLDRRAKK